MAVAAARSRRFLRAALCAWRLGGGPFQPPETPCCCSCSWDCCRHGRPVAPRPCAPAAARARPDCDTDRRGAQLRSRPLTSPARATRKVVERIVRRPCRGRKRLTREPPRKNRSLRWQSQRSDSETSRSEFRIQHSGIRTKARDGDHNHPKPPVVEPVPGIAADTGGRACPFGRKPPTATLQPVSPPCPLLSRVHSHTFPARSKMPASVAPPGYMATGDVCPRSVGGSPWCWRQVAKGPRQG